MSPVARKSQTNLALSTWVSASETGLRRTVASGAPSQLPTNKPLIAEWGSVLNTSFDSARGTVHSLAPLNKMQASSATGMLLETGREHSTREICERLSVVQQEVQGPLTGPFLACSTPRGSLERIGHFSITECLRRKGNAYIDQEIEARSISRCRRSFS